MGGRVWGPLNCIGTGAPLTLPALGRTFGWLLAATVARGLVLVTTVCP